MTQERINTNAGTPCAHVEIDYLVTTTEFQLIATRGYDAATGTLTGSSTLDNPITWFTSTMRINSSWADASTITFVPPASGNAAIEKYTLAGVEDVTVPYNGGTTYTACLKIHRSQQNAWDGTTSISHHESILWFCPAVGFAKSMTVTSLGVLVTRELSDIQ